MILDDLKKILKKIARDFNQKIIKKMSRIFKRFQKDYMKKFIIIED